MKNKKGNSATWVVVILLSVLVLAVIGGGAYFMFGIKQQAVGTSNQNVNTGGLGGTTLVTTNPIISISGQDAQQSGTTVTTASTSKYSKDSTDNYALVTLGTTTAVPGQIIRLFLVNGSTYHNQVWNKDGGITVKANSFPVDIAFNKNATVTENIYYQNSKLSNGNGTTNLTDLGNGASYSMTDEMQVNALTSTQEMVCVFDLTAGVNASTETPGLTYGGKQSENLETSSWYTPLSTNSKLYTFTIPALSDTNPVQRNILIASKSTGQFSQPNYLVKTCYTKEWFIDPNTGVLTFDVANSQGTVQSLAQYKFTVYFG